jgi:hypothetical protein
MMDLVPIDQRVIDLAQRLVPVPGRQGRIRQDPSAAIIAY